MPRLAKFKVTNDLIRYAFHLPEDCRIVLIQGVTGQRDSIFYVESPEFPDVLREKDIPEISPMFSQDTAPPFVRLKDWGFPKEGG